MINQKRVIPILMLHKELLYNSTKFSNFRYIGDPLISVKIFNEKEAQEICLIDSGISRKNSKINFSLLESIASECFMPLSYGGGICSISDIEKLIRIGFEKIILNTVLHDNPSFLAKAITSFGSSTIVGCIDFKKIDNQYTVFTNGGRNTTHKTVQETATWLNNTGVGEIILNNIDLDGSMSGLDIQIISEVCSMVSVPVVAIGGIGQTNHIHEGFKTDLNAIGVGSFCVYKGPLNAVLINYPDKKRIKELTSQ
jgi:cyclase